MSLLPNDPLKPRSFDELISQVIILAKSSETGIEAAKKLSSWLNALSADYTLAPSMARIRAKGIEALRQRTANQAFELRYRLGRGETVVGWENLRLALAKLGLHYKISTLKARLCSGKMISQDLLNPDTETMDVFTVAKIVERKPKARRGRPVGAIARPPVTTADRIQTIVNPTGNKMRGIL